MAHDIYTPKRILVDLTNKYTTKVRADDDGEVVDFELGFGDIIPLPTREQIAAYVYPKKRKKGDVEDALNLDIIAEHINNNRWSEKTIADHSLMFFFSANEEQDKIVVGTGSERDPFNVCMTSYALIYDSNTNNQPDTALFGIDGTYNTLKEGFVTTAFGRIDMRRQYHPIVFMITSHECSENYTYFYRSLAMITANLNIPLTIPYLMQDASKAEYAAIKEVYPNTSLLMCYFHVKKNLHDNWSKYDVPDSLRQELANDTTFLHQSRYYEEYI